MKHEIYNNEEEVNDNECDRSQSRLTIEEAMEVVGQKNRYQVYVMAISFLVWFVTTYGYMVIPYYLSVPDFECFKDGEWVVCEESNGACDNDLQVRMLTPKESTISADLSLYCNKRQSRVIIESLPLFAGMFGTFFFVYISDKWGRRMAIQICWIMGIASSFLLNFSQSEIGLIFGSFGVGFSALILQSLVLVHLNELSIGQYRVISLIGTYVFWSLSEMQYIWMIAVLPGWKWNMFAFYTLPICLLMFVAVRMFHDSPRYLYIKDRAKCLESLNRIAIFNERQTISDGQLIEYKGDVEKEYSYLDLFTFPSQRKITINMSLVYLFVNFLYQGTQVVLNTVGASFGESSLYVGIGELIGFAFSDVLASRIPRRIGIFLSLGATSVICISYYFFPIPSACIIDPDVSCWQKPFQGFMIAFARAISSITFGLQVLMCGEIYPTTMKSLGFGFNIGVGYFGTFLAPYAVDIAHSLSMQPMVLIGLISFIGNFSSLWSQETLNVTAPMDIPEVEESQRITAAVTLTHKESNDDSPQKAHEMQIAKDIDSIHGKTSEEIVDYIPGKFDKVILIHQK